MSDPEIVDHQSYTEDTVAVVPVGTTRPPSVYRATTEKATETARNAYRLIKMAVLILLGFVLALFVFRNWEDVNFDYVFGDANMPLAVVMLIFTLVGIAIGTLVYWFLLRRTSRE